MEEDATLATREQYLELLIDASFRDASEIESGFMSWCERHVPSGGNRDMMKRGFVNALPWPKAREVSTAH